MAGVVQLKPPPLSVDIFRTFVAGRPEEERWELIDGVAVMRAPLTIAHQQIASNLQRILHDALERRALAMTPFQRVGVNLGPCYRKLRSRARRGRHRQRRGARSRRTLCRSVLSGGGGRLAERCCHGGSETRGLQAARGLHVHSHRATEPLRGPRRLADRRRMDTAGLEQAGQRACPCGFRPELHGRGCLSGHGAPAAVRPAPELLAQSVA